MPATSLEIQSQVSSSSMAAATSLGAGSPPPSYFPEKEGEDITTESLLKSTSSPLSTGRSFSTAVVFSILLLTTCASLSAAFGFAFLFFSSSSSSSSAVTTTKTQHPRSTSRSVTTLPHPVLLLISSDGFRFGYQYKTHTPNIHRLIDNGTEAATGLIPVFPTLTFPNHYSIVTGLYPPYHGIINNYFVDPVDGDRFSMSSHEPKWWLGEPLWETVVNHGLKAATYFWPGSEVKKGAWDCSPEYCQMYNESVPFDQRVDTILSYFDHPVESDKLPSFLTLYFEDPDEQGHKVGPDDVAITAAVANIDRLIGRIIEGLEERNVFQDVHVILVGDHGMVGTCDKKLITLSNLSPWIEIPNSWIQSTTPVLSIRPTTASPTPADVVSKMNEALESGKVENGARLKMYLKEDLPKRLHYADSYRIPPIVGILDEGYTVEKVRSTGRECGGAHGYDNRFFSMRTVFAAHGPRFQRGMKIPSFENVEIYNLVAAILGIEGAPNNGSSEFAKRVLLPIKE